MKRNYLRLSAAALFAFATLDAPAQSLPVTTGLQLWLKADAGVTTNSSGQVTAWTDQSPQANNATAVASTAPTLLPGSQNGLPILNFTSGKFLEVPSTPTMSSLTSDVTLLTVVKYANLSGYRCVVNKCIGNKAAPFDFWNNSTANGGRTTFYLGNGTAVSGAMAGQVTPATNVFNILGASWKDNALTQHFNDMPNGSFTTTAVVADGGTALRIGRRIDAATTLVGALAEVLIYQPALSDAQRTEVVTYLKSKWGMVFNLAPSVSIATPTNNSTTAAPGTVPVNISASDPDGTLARVDLYKNNTLLASSTRAPYQLNLQVWNPGTAILTAVATDNNNRSATSAPVAITVTGTAPAAPLATGLQVWLKADAGVTTNVDGLVTTWSDQSGNGNDATQFDPASAPLLQHNTINGKPALSFGYSALATNEFLDVQDAGTSFTASNFSTFSVSRFVDFSSFRVIWTKTQGGQASPVEWHFNPTTGQAVAYRGTFGNFGAAITGRINPPRADFATFGLMANGERVSHSLGFTETGFGLTPTPPIDDAVTLRIGRRDDGATQMKGDIAEILIYNEALSPSASSNVVSYLSSKYGRAEAQVLNQISVSITSPTGGTSVASPAIATFTTAASDLAGTITRVDLLANGLTLASLTNAPYEIKVDLLTPGNVELTAIAYNNWGLTQTSAPVVVTVTGTMPASPVTGGLRMWLKADAGVIADFTGAITQWDDQSGQGNHAYSSTGPLIVPNALGGRPVVRFGTNSATYLEVSPSATMANFTTNFSAFVIARVNSFTGKYPSIIAKTIGNWPRPFEWLYSGAAAHVGQPELTLGFGAAPNTGNLHESWATKSAVAGAWQIPSVVVGNNTVSHYLNHEGVGNTTFTLVPEDGGYPLRIGSRDDFGTQMNGDIAEILLYDRTLTHNERVQVINYLSGKYGLAVVQVANEIPSVGITSPTNGTTVVAPDLLSISVNANDPENALDRVEFLVNGRLLSTQKLSPFRIPLEMLTPGVVTLQARAFDVWGASSISAPIMVTVTGTAPATPPTGAKLWLRANAGVSTNLDGTVSGWADQSGNANHALEPYPSGGPVLITDPTNGLPALQFDGTTRYLDIVNSLTTDLRGEVSLFYTASFTDYFTPRGIVGRCDANQPRPFDYYVTGGGSARLYRGGETGATGVSGSTGMPSGQYVVAGVVSDPNTATHYYNGFPNGTGSFGYGQTDTGKPLRVGSRDDFGTQFKGEMSEILLFDRVLSENDLQMVNSYLAGKQGVPLFQLATKPGLRILRSSTAAVEVSWPLGFSGYILEGSTALGSSWTPVVTNPPNNTVSIGTTNSARFYRLRSQ